MPGVYADMPRFKHIHQGLMETMRQHDVGLEEIERALSGRRSAKDQATLRDLKKKCEDIK